MSTNITTRPAIGEKIPTFTLPATGDKLIGSDDLKGRKTILYFYPRDNTPGCTLESCAFEKFRSQFSEFGTDVIGVSRDNLKSHQRFQQKYNLTFDLIADTEEQLCQAFDVMRNKNMYGKAVRGIERSTFLIDEEGRLIKEWRKVKAEGHAEAVLAEIKNLSKK